MLKYVMLTRQNEIHATCKYAMLQTQKFRLVIMLHMLLSKDNTWLHIESESIKTKRLNHKVQITSRMSIS